MPPPNYFNADLPLAENTEKNHGRCRSCKNPASNMADLCLFPDPFGRLVKGLATPRLASSFPTVGWG